MNLLTQGASFLFNGAKVFTIFGLKEGFFFGPRIGFFAINAVTQIFSSLFAVPLFLITTLYKVLTFFIEWSFSIISYLSPFLANLINITIPRTTEIKESIVKTIQKFLDYVKNKNVFIRSLFELLYVLVKFVLDLVFATYKALPNVFILVFMIYVWFFTGFPLLFLEAFPQTVSDNVNVYVEGFTSSINLFTVLYNNFAAITNTINPLVQISIYFVAQVITLLSQELTGAFSFDNTASAGGGSVQNRNLATAEEISEGIKNEIENRWQNTVDIFQTQFVTYSDGYIYAEKSALFFLSPFFFAALTSTELLLIVIEIFIRLFVPLLRPIIDAISGGGQSASCCFFVDPTASAIGYCFVNFFLSILKSILKLIGLSTPGIIEGVNSLLPTKLYEGIPCTCNVIMKPVPACTPPRYECPEVFQNNILYYQEVSIRRKSVKEVETVRGALNTVQSLACPNYLRRSKQVKRENVRSLDTAQEEECRYICHRQNINQWFFEVCGEQVFYKGACDDDVYVKDPKKHLMKFLILKDDVFTPQQRQILLHTHIEIKAKSESPPPTVFFESKEEDDDTVDLEKLVYNFKEKVKQVEKVDAPGCPEEFGSDYVDMLLRTVCLVYKFFVMHPVKFEQFQHAANFPRHLEFLNDHEKLKEYHIQWHKESGYGESFVESLNLTAVHIVSNLTFQALHYKLKVQDYERENLRRRSLNEDNPFVSQYPPCEYKCPAGECVARNELSRCTVPQNWTLGTTTRYVAFLFTAGLNELDAQFLLESTISCWQEYTRNPSINPVSTRGFLDYVSGSDMKDYVYCFPMWNRIPYSPTITWSWYKYIKSLCEENFILDGSSAVSRCFCIQYCRDNIFDYTAWSTVFSRQFIVCRLFNGWKVIQWLYVNTFFQPSTNWFWKGLWTWLLPWASDEWLLAFDYEFALSGQTSDKNWGCAILHLGSCSWVLIFIVYMSYILISFYAQAILDFFFGFLTVIIITPAFGCMERCSKRLKRYEVEKVLKKKLKTKKQTNITMKDLIV